MAGTEVYNNILHSSCCHALVANQNQVKSGTLPRNVKIIGNTIVALNPSSLGQECFESRYWSTNAGTFEVRNNLILCGDDTTYTSESAFYFDSSKFLYTIESNAYHGVDNISEFSNTNLKLSTIASNVVDLANYNYYPKIGAIILTAGAYYSEANQDIDCVLRGIPRSTHWML